jgi:hypothetical protein
VTAGFSLTTSAASSGLLANCTAGFTVRDTFGFQFLVLAAHCVGPGLDVTVDNFAFGAALVDRNRDVAVVANALPRFWRQQPRIQLTASSSRRSSVSPSPR